MLFLDHGSVWYPALIRCCLRRHLDQEIMPINHVLKPFPFWRWPSFKNGSKQHNVAPVICRNSDCYHCGTVAVQQLGQAWLIAIPSYKLIRVAVVLLCFDPFESIGSNAVPNGEDHRNQKFSTGICSTAATTIDAISARCRRQLRSQYVGSDMLYSLAHYIECTSSISLVEKWKCGVWIPVVTGVLFWEFAVLPE